MILSTRANDILSQITNGNVKLGNLRKIAKEIKRDHELAMQLWSTGHYFPRLLAILILDSKCLNQVEIDSICKDIQIHIEAEQVQLIDWLMANQLSKNKKTTALMESWEYSHSRLQRRLFWYYQARLRWMGKTKHSNTEDLLDSIEKNLLNEDPIVQWAMNYTAGQIGKWQEKYRSRCIKIGIEKGLYKDEVVAKNCTPNYLPKFIAIEVEKLKSL